jgi:hypothetical protein
MVVMHIVSPLVQPIAACMERLRSEPDRVVRDLTQLACYLLVTHGYPSFKVGYVGVLPRLCDSPVWRKSRASRERRCDGDSHAQWTSLVANGCRFFRPRDTTFRSRPFDAGLP